MQHQSLRIKKSKQYVGRGIFADADIKQLYSTISTENPFVSYPSFDFQRITEKYCEHCFGFCEDSVKCTKCNDRYCGADCQREAWNEYHVNVQIVLFLMIIVGGAVWHRSFSYCHEM